jgi:N-methylhydantoinase A/oxoprolinase/acetone carboxylase beta subunit
MSLRLGIDVGGTNTDAVLMRGREVLGAVKRPNTERVVAGITAAVADLLRQTGTAAADVGAVMIGTTQFANAVVERRRLAPTAAIRLGLPATACLPPMVDWPDDLRAAIGGLAFLVHGGYEFDGRELSPFDAEEVRRAAEAIRARGVRAVAITGVFAPVNPAMEQAAAAVVRQVVPEVRCTLSHELGRIGLLERENATILNASLMELAAGLVGAFRTALASLGITAPVYFTQNDGTLMGSEFVERFPVLTFSSGPTNSMRGAAFLSGLRDAVVVDVGGTTTDIGMLVRGFPREAAAVVEIGGVRTNFRMPDILSLGLGGGSVVRTDPLRIGPDSVGYEIVHRALVFGGDVLTATDVVVAAGHAAVGDPARVAGLDPALVQAALARIHAMVSDGIDRVKTSPAPVPVVLVGGGSILLTRRPDGTSEVHRPPHFAAANAIGAAIAQVGGEVDRVFALAGRSRAQVLAEARQEATARAVQAGADPETVEIVEVDEVPLAYLPGNATRIRVKAVGDLVLA